MLILILKNETGKSYDSIRRAMKVAYKDSAAYRTRQVEFDDSLKGENTLQMKIGDYRAMNLQLTCTVTDVKQMSMVISDLMDEPNKGKKKGSTQPEKVAEPAPTEESDTEKLYAGDEVIAEAAVPASEEDDAIMRQTGVGEGAIIQTSEGA